MKKSLVLSDTMQLPEWLAADNHDALVALLRCYYAGRLDYDNLGRGYRGAYFDEWSSRRPGERDPAPDMIGEADLYSLEYLSARVPSSAGIEFIHRQSAELSRLLAQIPTDVDLWDMDERLYKSLDALYAKLREPVGVAYVRSAKIIAKKRPRLSCVFDRNVKKAFGVGLGQYLMPLARMLQANREVVELLRRLRVDAELPRSISEMRVLDVIAWMIGDKELFGVGAE